MADFRVGECSNGRIRDDSACRRRSSGDDDDMRGECCTGGKGIRDGGGAVNDASGSLLEERLRRASQEGKLLSHEVARLHRIRFLASRILLLLFLFLCWGGASGFSLRVQPGTIGLSVDGVEVLRSGGIAGLPFDVQPVVSGVDLGYSFVHTILGNNPSCGELRGNSTADVLEGEAKFTDLSFDIPGRNVVLRFCAGMCSESGNRSILSPPFGIRFGRLVVIEGVSGAQAGSAFIKQPVVRIEKVVDRLYVQSIEYDFPITAHFFGGGQVCFDFACLRNCFRPFSLFSASLSLSFSLCIPLLFLCAILHVSLCAILCVAICRSVCRKFVYLCSFVELSRVQCT